ncbi:L-rhamnose mutarotase [Lacisediminihabitans sp. H27-G8]|uniref:L-rhamnose mutarotase n=1 Tax=Lacisediminihabitans sp. H27-G8 TaxID=3111909 RepID=UPI0038FD153B
MDRICFQLRVKPERLDEYTERHARVWPEMLREIAASGRRNYSLFLRPDGLLIGYFETDDLAASQDYLDASTVAADWEREMGDFFEDLDGARPDQGFDRLDEVFNLDDQLTSLRTNGVNQNGNRS